MDPDDFPDIITLQLEDFDPNAEGATEILLDAFNSCEDSLPLQDLCMNGGHPSSDTMWPVKSVSITNIDGNSVKGILSVAFTEVCPTGCRDLNWRDEVKDKFMYSLDCQTGDCEIESFPWKREYDPEEF